MRTKNRSAAWLFAALLLLASMNSLHGQVPVESTPPAASSQVVSQTGLLPVYGIDMSIDASWVDGTAFPSKQSSEFPNLGVSPSFQQAWDTIRPAGFNCMRFHADVQDPAWVARTANLCVWGMANGVKIVPVLVGPADVGFPAKAADFIKKLATMMRADAQSLPAYSQILAIHIQDKMNNPGLHAGVASEAAADLLAQSAAATRAAETEALKDSGVFATPIMVNISFDCELVKAKSMAGVTLTDAAREQACQSAGAFIKQLVSRPDIDIYNLEWFAGSIGAGSVDKLPELLKCTNADLAGKQITVTTGFSTGFNQPTDQKAYYTAAFTNLVQYRAQEAANGSFLGVFFHEAIESAVQDQAPPSPDLPAKIAQWDWTAKSAELAAMWNGGAASPELAWWYDKARNHMGLLSRTTDPAGASALAPQPGFDALLQIAGAVTDANAQMASAPPPAPDATGATPFLADTSGSPGSTGGSYRSKLKEGLFGLIDKVFQKIGEKVMTIGTGGTGGAPGMDWTQPAAPVTAPLDTSMPGATTTPALTTTTLAVSVSITPSDVTFSPASPQVGQQTSASVTVRNLAATEAAGLSVALVDANGYVIDTGAQQNGVNVPASGSTTAALTWTPVQAGSVALTANVYDSYLNKVATAPVSVTVAAPGGAPTTTPAVSASSHPVSSTTTTAPHSSNSATPPATPASESGVECAKADVTLTPSIPKAGELTKIKVKLHNQDDKEAAGIDVLLVDMAADPSGSLLGEVDGNKVGGKSSRTVEVNWTPTEARSYQLGVQVWRGFDQMLAQVQLDTIKVEAQSPGSDKPKTPVPDNTPAPSNTPAGVIALNQASVHPASLKVGSPAVVKAGVKNGSNAESSALDLYLVDSVAPWIALAQASIGKVAKNAEKSADLSWLPDKAGTLNLEVQLWDAGGLLYTKSLGITVAASGSGEDGPSGTDQAVSDSGGESSDGKKLLGPWNVRPGKLPGLPGPDPDPFISQIPLGLPEVHDLVMGFDKAGPGGQIPVSLSLANTFKHSISGLKASLMLDGKQMQTISLGTMIPGQTRALQFAPLPLPGVGKHTMKLVIEGIASKPLSGSVERQINISSRLLATAGALSSGKSAIARPTVKPPTPQVAHLPSTPLRLATPQAFNIGGKVFAASKPVVPAPVANRCRGLCQRSPRRPRQPRGP